MENSKVQTLVMIVTAVIMLCVAGGGYLLSISTAEAKTEQARNGFDRRNCWPRRRKKKAHYGFRGGVPRMPLMRLSRSALPLFLML